ncbi:MAG: helix-turn-helix transcriptional regulator [Alphaproteobacteria bacterium]
MATSNQRLDREAETWLTGWYRALGALIDDLDGADLPERLVQALSELMPFELAAVFVYRGRSRPLNLYDNFELADAKKGIAAYIENTYVLNPFYQACQKGLMDGVYRIRDLAPDAFFESEYYQSHRILPRRSEEIGYLTEDWPKGLEEIDIAIRLEPDVISEISVYRATRNRGFSDDELARLSMAVPLIAALLRRYWSRFGAFKLQTSPPDSRIDQIFANFGKSVLTDREREVTQLILRGHSSESIGFSLKISLGTVKTHRKNAYAKLGISSQSELLSLFLKSFETD